MQPQGQTQIVMNMVDFGMDPQAAGDAARWRHSGSSQPTGTVMTDGGTVQLEAGVCPAVRADLEGRGHTLEYVANGFGGYQAIWWDSETGVYHAGSELRKDGMAMAY